MASGLNKNVKKMVGVLVKSLSVRNKDVILRRFGLKSGKRETGIYRPKLWSNQRKNQAN